MIVGGRVEKQDLSRTVKDRRLGGRWLIVW